MRQNGKKMVQKVSLCRPPTLQYYLLYPIELRRMRRAYTSTGTSSFLSTEPNPTGTGAKQNELVFLENPSLQVQEAKTVNLQYYYGTKHSNNKQQKAVTSTPGKKYFNTFLREKKTKKTTTVIFFWFERDKIQLLVKKY